MMEVYNLIKSIQKRPLMYIHEEKIDYIYYLLVGYCAALTKHNSPTEMDKKFSFWFGKWLNDWIKFNYDDNCQLKTYCWGEILKEITKSEEEAVQLFYKLCERFFSDYEDGKGYFEWKNNQN